MPTRFAILHHRLVDGEHWDLMLEYDDVLLTWQLAREPTGSRTLPIPARRIQDHRKAYLEYEGPVSGDRGFVRRVDQGSVRISHLTPRRCRFDLAGERLSGRFVISSDDGESWVLDSDFTGHEKGGAGVTPTPP